MKKIFVLIFICLLVLCGCGKEEVVDSPVDDNTPNQTNKDTSLEKNIITSEVALFNGEFNDRNIVLKVRNNNDKPVYLNYAFEVFDKNKTKLYNKEVNVRVGSNDEAYVVAIQDLEESSFETYTYKMNILDEKLEDYSLIKGSIKSDYTNDGKSIIVTFSNTGTRVTTVYGLLFFYKGNSLVAVKDVTSYNLIPYKVDNIKVSYPLKSVSKIISFDNVKLVVNEVSTEL